MTDDTSHSSLSSGEAGAGAGQPDPSLGGSDKGAGSPAPTDQPTGNPEDKSLIDGGGTPDDKSRAPADWPEDWRKRMAGEDDKALKALERVKSPADLYKSFAEAQELIRSGKAKAAPTLPDNPTDEQLAAYREAAGIPEKAEGYLEKLPDGIVIGDEDKELFTSFAAAAHEKNLPPEAVNAAIEWYYNLQNDTVAETVEADREYKKAAEDTLRAEWGGEYRMNLNAAKGYIDSLPTVETKDGEEVGLGELLMGARLKDGTMLGDNPGMLKWLADQAEASNPALTVVPAGGTANLDTVQARIAEIENVMKTNRSAYDKDQKMQAELLRLYDVEAKMSAKAS